MTMDKTIRKAQINKKPKIKSGSDTGDSLLAKELDHLTEELVEAAEEMEHVSGEESTLEDIEGAKTLASEALEHLGGDQLVDGVVLDEEDSQRTGALAGVPRYGRNGSAEG